MTAIRVFARALRALVLVSLVVAALPVGSAFAQTTTQTTIGQVGGTGGNCNGEPFPGTGSTLGDPQYVVPSGGGTITSFSFQSIPLNAGQQLAFLVLRHTPGPGPAGGTTTNWHTVVGTTGLQTLKGMGLETFTANIPVQAGDILGFWLSPVFDNCLRQPVNSPTLVAPGEASSPSAGSIVQFSMEMPSLGDLNLSATLVATPTLPTSMDQCRSGGWMSFGVFRNQGECVSFVATGGRNGPRRQSLPSNRTARGPAR
jgi:hypothetical protein